MEVIAVGVLAIICGPAALNAFIPATLGSAAFCFTVGGSQIVLGVMLYLMIYAGGGVDWPWVLLIAFLGVCYVSRGMQIRLCSTGDIGRRNSDH